MNLSTQASILSCRAILLLSKKQYEHNKQFFNNQMKCPEETAPHPHQERAPISRLEYDSMCFKYDDSLTQGAYSNQYQDVRSETFNTWTRKKEIVQHPTSTSIQQIVDDLDAQFFTIEPDTSVNCGLHPTPCKI